MIIAAANRAEVVKPEKPKAEAPKKGTKKASAKDAK